MLSDKENANVYATISHWKLEGGTQAMWGPKIRMVCVLSYGLSASINMAHLSQSQTGIFRVKGSDYQNDGNSVAWNAKYCLKYTRLPKSNTCSFLISL